MSLMNKMNELSLDGRLLQMFVLVYKTTSVTEAALQLDMTQSAVSHGLARLRKITGDPLFVASGRGIVSTPRAHILAKQAEEILTQLEQFKTVERYDPLIDDGDFAIAAYDYEVETVLRLVLPLLRQQAPNLTLRVVQAHGQTELGQVLRENRADLVFTLAKNKVASDLSQQILFDDCFVCFYDSNIRLAPNSLDAYVSAPHALVKSDESPPCEVEASLMALGVSRQIVLVAPSFGAVATLIQSSDIVATLPSRLKDTLFSTFSFVEPPFETNPIQIAQVWHNRNTASERHRWFRRLICDVVKATYPVGISP